MTEGWSQLVKGGSCLGYVEPLAGGWYFGDAVVKSWWERVEGGGLGK